MLLLLTLLPAVGCDSATPVAPDGAVITISANPSQVALNGRSTITVVGRKPDGQPLNPGTEIRLSAERGTIESVVTTDDQGRATATFRADGRTGDVKITASTGGGDTKAETTVLVGQSDSTRPTVLVSVTPSTISFGATAEVTVIARNADGTPINGGRATITTSLGRLEDPTPNIVNGLATTTLAAGQREGTATITAIVGSSAAATTTATIVLDAATAISVTATPSEIDAGKPATIRVTATVTNNRAQPVVGALVTFEAGRGDFEDTQSETTDERGQATKTLTLTAADTTGTFTSFEVTAKTPSSSGSTFLEGTTEVTVNRPSGGGG